MKTQSRMLFTNVADFLYVKEDFDIIGMLQYYHKETWELSYVSRGAGVATIAGVSTPFSSGDVFLISPYMPHRWDFAQKSVADGSKIQRVCLNINDSFLSRCYSMLSCYVDIEAPLGERFGKAVKFDKDVSAQIISVLDRMDGESRAMQMTDVLKLLVFMSGSHPVLPGEHKPQRSADEEALSKIIAYTKLNANRNISLAEISQYIGMSKSAFCAFFKKQTGKSFVSYLDEYRIDSACSILDSNSSKTISDICFETGFNSAAYFNRVFRKYKGVSPSEYRTALQQKTA